MTRGSCLCGEIAYEVRGEPEHMTHCHCTMCRKIHGSLFATYVMVPKENFSWMKGAERAVSYESSPGFTRAFCRTCGSVIPVVDDDEDVAMPAGNLESDCGVRPEAHIFVKSKAPWYTITDDLPQYDAYDPGTDLPDIALGSRGSGRHGVVGGSCLCGAVGFEYEGSPKFMMNCHCSRCQRVKGAAHASNVFVAPDAFRWLKGEELVITYKLPEAERFGHAFCGRCGSSVARVVPGAPVVNVPAGSLDDPPGIEPRGHIYVAYKAPWFELSDDLPRFDELPPS